MTRFHPVWLLIALATALAGAPAIAADRTQQIWQQLPVPPVPPPQAPSVAPGMYQPAPIPNPDLLPPPQQSNASDPSLTPHLFMPRDRFAGDGYIPGSTVQSEQERRMKPGAGFNLQLPFD